MVTGALVVLAPGYRRIGVDAVVAVLSGQHLQQGLDDVHLVLTTDDKVHGFAGPSTRLPTDQALHLVVRFSSQTVRHPPDVAPPDLSENRGTSGRVQLQEDVAHHEHEVLRSFHLPWILQHPGVHDLQVSRHDQLPLPVTLHLQLRNFVVLESLAIVDGLEEGEETGVCQLLLPLPEICHHVRQISLHLFQRPWCEPAAEGQLSVLLLNLQLDPEVAQVDVQHVDTGCQGVEGPEENNK